MKQFLFVALLALALIGECHTIVFKSQYKHTFKTTGFAKASSQFHDFFVVLGSTKADLDATETPIVEADLGAGKEGSRTGMCSLNPLKMSMRVALRAPANETAKFRQKKSDFHFILDHCSIGTPKNELRVALRAPAYETANYAFYPESVNFSLDS